MSKVYSAPAKINVFLKIVDRLPNGYHQIASRFIRVESLSDKMWFDNASIGGFEVVGDFGCEMSENTIHKAMVELKKAHPSRELANFLRNHKVVVYKEIPSGGGLGGGSSNAATFLKMINIEAGLGLADQELAKIGLKVGADVPFFVSGQKSANVAGVGEMVIRFDEEPPIVEIFTPKIACNTAEVYRKFRQNFANEMELNRKMSKKLTPLTTKELVNSYKLTDLNDLYKAAIKSYPELIEFAEDGWFFSGSGSSFFRILR